MNTNELAETPKTLDSTLGDDSSSPLSSSSIYSDTLSNIAPRANSIGDMSSIEVEKIVSPVASTKKTTKTAIQIDEDEVDESPATDDGLNEPDEDEEDEEDEDLVYPNPKRKRPSINYSYDGPLGHYFAEEPEPDPKWLKGPTGPESGLKGVIIGVWRKSSKPNNEDKQVIYAFIDADNRLRTRGHAMNRRGEPLKLKTGTGKSWISLEDTIFDDHLKALSSAELKEYVRIRTDDKPIPTDEPGSERDYEAVEEAKAIVAKMPRTPGDKPGTPPTPPISTRLFSRQTLRSNDEPNVPSPVDKVPTEAQTMSSKGILVGYWKHSEERELRDKHAVFGVIIVERNCLRFKILKSTRDGRFMGGNYPGGPGKYWIRFSDVVLEPHLKGLSQKEIKEYVRIRERDRKKVESEKERLRNEQEAVKKATRAAARAEAVGSSGATIVQDSDPENQSDSNTEANPGPGMNLRRRKRPERNTSFEDPDSEVGVSARKKRKTNTPFQAAKARENEDRDEQGSKAEFDEFKRTQRRNLALQKNVGILDKNWRARNSEAFAHTTSQNSAQVKHHDGGTYTLKQSGLLEGKLVRPLEPVTIDGEDWLEYRLLSKVVL